MTREKWTHHNLRVYMKTYYSFTVRKHLRLTDDNTTSSTRLIYLLEDEFEKESKMRIVIPPSHRYQALLTINVREHWGVQRTTQQVKQFFYWPGWRRDTQRKNWFEKCRTPWKPCNKCKLSFMHRSFRSHFNIKK